MVFLIIMVQWLCLIGLCLFFQWPLFQEAKYTVGPYAVFQNIILLNHYLSNLIKFYLITTYLLQRCWSTHLYPLLPQVSQFCSQLHSSIYSRRKYYCCHQNAKYFLLPFKKGSFLYYSQFSYRSSSLWQQKLSLLISLLQFLYEFCRLVHFFFSVLLPIQLSLFYVLKSVSKKQR